MGRIRTWLTDPDIGSRLLRDEGEVIVEVVRKHWVVYIIPALIVLVGLLCWVVMPFIDVSLGWAPLLVGAGLILWGVGRALDRNLDQFVITNMRVFRIHGLLSRSQATMPLGRILDITVVQPLQGRMLGYGHLTFGVRRPGPGSARHPLRLAPHPARPGDPAPRAASRVAWSEGAQLRGTQSPAAARRSARIASSRPAAEIRAASRRPRVVHRHDDLEVALDLGLGARRAHDDARRRRGGSAARRSAAGRREPSERSSSRSTARPPSEVGGWSRSRSIVAGIAQVGDPDRELVGRVQAVLAGDVVEPVAQRPALGLAPGSVGDQQQRGDAVLVPHVVGGDAVAERLLVAEREAWHPADPLEAGERLGVRLAAPRRPSAEQRGGHDRRGVDTRRRPGAAGGRRAAPPTSSPRSIRQPCGPGTATAQRSASGSLATTTSASTSPASAIARSIAPGSSGLGNATVGKSGSGRPGRRPRAARSKPASLQNTATELAADAVQRCVDDRSGRAGPSPASSTTASR